MRNRLPLFGCLITALVELSAGCTTPAAEDHACSAVTATIDDPNVMPDDVLAYLAAHHWSHMHLDFHVARQWDILDSSTQEWASNQGISRADLQEGAPNSGIEFLAMHRLMLQELREKFPEHVALFEGWSKVPTDPADPTGTLPPTTRPFDASILAGVDRLENDVGSFDTDDDFALFLQTKRRPTEDNPRGRTFERGAGAHNYLHTRFASDSPINVGDPAVNLQNQVFWRIHGWVDARWTAYRQAKGLDDATDPVYVGAMKDANEWMDAAMERAHTLGDKADDACEQEPETIRNLFAE